MHLLHDHCFTEISGPKEMMLKGEVKLNGMNRVLPSPSCLFVFLEDISRMDVPAALIGFHNFNLSGFNTKNTFQYSLKIKKPADDELWRKYALVATTHVGYCPDKRSSIRTGDYVTDEVHRLKLTQSAVNYVMNLNLSCYGMYWKCNLRD